MSIFDELREDHEKQRTLVELVIKTQGDSDGRAELFARLKEAVEHHALAEERFFYVPLLEHDLSQEKTRHSFAEHHEIDELFKNLEETDPSSSGWLATAKKLKESLTHHMDEEEQEVFQLAGKALPQTAQKTLAAEYRQHMQELEAN